MAYYLFCCILPKGKWLPRFLLVLPCWFHLRSIERMYTNLGNLSWAVYFFNVFKLTNKKKKIIMQPVCVDQQGLSVLEILRTHWHCLTQHGPISRPSLSKYSCPAWPGTEPQLHGPPVPPPGRGSVTISALQLTLYCILSFISKLSFYIYLPHSHGQLHVHNKDHLKHHIFISFFLRWQSKNSQNRHTGALMQMRRCVIINRPHFPACWSSTSPPPQQTHSLCVGVPKIIR